MDTNELYQAYVMPVGAQTTESVVPVSGKGCALVGGDGQA